VDCFLELPPAFRFLLKLSLANHFYMFCVPLRPAFLVYIFSLPEIPYSTPCPVTPKIHQDSSTTFFELCGSQTNTRTKNIISCCLFCPVFMLSFFFINCIIKYCCLFCWRLACDGLGSTGSLSHFIYMFIHLYVWFLCEK